MHLQVPFSSSSSAISFSSSLNRFAPNPFLSTLFSGGFRPTTSPSPFLIRMGGGPRTYPGGVTKWQWKRMQAKKAKQLLKARLLRERQLYEMRKRTELRAAVAELERPWEVVEQAPNLFSVSADDQVKALADRFQRPGGLDMWNERDGPQVFRAPDGLKSARFFPKGVVHSVKPYGIVGEEESDEEEGAASSGDEVFVDLSVRGAEGARRTRSSGRRSGYNAWGSEEKKNVSEAIDIEATMLDGDDGFRLGTKDSKYIDWIDKSNEETKDSGNRLTNSSRRRQGSGKRISPNEFRSSPKHSQVINAETGRNSDRRKGSSGDHRKGVKPESGNRFLIALMDELPPDTVGRTGKISDANNSRRRRGSGNWNSPNEFSSSSKHPQAQATDTRRTSFNRRNVSSNYRGKSTRPGSWSRFGETPMNQRSSDTMGISDNMVHSGKPRSLTNSRSKSQKVSLRPTTSLYYEDGDSQRDRKSTWNLEDELQEEF